MQKVINFSGGKTSAYMTIQEYKEGDLVIFCDTGREHPKTYKFINDFEANENIPIIRLKYEGGFEKLIENRKAIPNNFKRFCTIELKIKTARRYLRSLGINKYENLIGFRYDEPLRVKRRRKMWKNVTDIFPLYEKEIDKAIINDYWSKKPYTLEIPSILGNCTLCFMKGKNAIINILSAYPELAEEWILDEKRSQEKGKGYTYFKDTTIEQLKNIAQNNLFKEQDLNLVTPAFDCACTS
jgi:3'-phosphoadenosine 5'-phosphosulfate sulfotransferase (PAPS reductase)/FAD synthetase